MRNGEKIWYCIRTSGDDAEEETFAEPQEEMVRLPNVFNPTSISVQPKNGYTDRLAYGETVSDDQRIILTPYSFWVGKFKIGDRFYLNGANPVYEEINGENANYYVEFVGKQNEAIELSVKKIINT